MTWSDHMQVCGLKYRFRKYDQLLRCLDLLEVRIATGGKRVPNAELVQRGAPVMIGWLRASAAHADHHGRITVAMYRPNETGRPCNGAR